MRCRPSVGRKARRLLRFQCPSAALVRGIPSWWFLACALGMTGTRPEVLYEGLYSFYKRYTQESLVATATCQIPDPLLLDHTTTHLPRTGFPHHPSISSCCGFKKTAPMSVTQA